MKQIIYLIAFISILFTGCTKEYKYAEFNTNGFSVKPGKEEIIKAKDNNEAYKLAYISFCSKVKANVDVYGSSDVVAFVVLDENGNDILDNLDKQKQSMVESITEGTMLKDDSVSRSIIDMYKEARSK